MAYKNLVYQTTTGTGTGNLTLTAATGWRNAATAFGTGAGNPFAYIIRHQSAAEYEVGTGYMSDATTLVRSAVVDSSNANAAVNFSAGTKDFWHAVPAADAANFVAQTLLDAKGDLIVASAADTAARLAVGTNGQILAAESGATNGLAWRWVPSYGVQMYVGDYFAVYHCVSNTTTSTSFVSGSLYAWPFVLSRDCTLDRMGTYFGGGGAGCKVRFGIYSDNNGRPDALQVESGELDGTLAAANTEVTISTALAAGTYWYAVGYYGGTVPGIRIAPNTPHPQSMYTAFSATSNSRGLVYTTLSGALPATFTVTGASTLIGHATFVVRASA